MGTGGDGAGLFNVSTASALVAAGAGAVIAKHGNRAVTGNSGSADLLEAGGVNIELTSEQVRKTIEAVGIGYMFAPIHHGAFRHLVGPRREIGVRTMFNLLGPLTNPAGAKHQLVGVYDRKWVRPIAEVFKNLGSIHTLVVHSQDGLDEISIAAPTNVSELSNGEVFDYVIANKMSWWQDLITNILGVTPGKKGQHPIITGPKLLPLLQSALSSFKC